MTGIYQYRISGYPTLTRTTPVSPLLISTNSSQHFDQLSGSSTMAMMHQLHFPDPGALELNLPDVCVTFCSTYKTVCP